MYVVTRYCLGDMIAERHTITDRQTNTVITIGLLRFAIDDRVTNFFE